MPIALNQMPQSQEKEKRPDMTTQQVPPVPDYRALELSRRGRLLTIAMNRPDSLNAVNLALHEELAEVFTFAAADEYSDVVVLTGNGRAFSAGGDMEHLRNNAENPDLFDEEVRLAKRIVFAMLDLDKPLVCRMNGHAVGLGATLALYCDMIFAADKAKIGDPHVAVGLVAGDGGAAVWPLRIGLCRAKEYLLTGELLPAPEAAEIGLINRAVPAEELDAAVDGYCERLLQGAQKAIRYTKVILNQELKRVTHAVLDTGLAYEALTIRSADHREAVKAMQEKRAPQFGRSGSEPSAADDAGEE
jgi:enoyl-CoA hydratase